MPSLSSRTLDFIDGIARAKRRSRLKTLDVPASRFDEIVDDVKENARYLWWTTWPGRDELGRRVTSFYLNGVLCFRVGDGEKSGGRYENLS